MKKIYIKSYLLKYISIKPKIQNLNRKKKGTKADKDDRSKSWICGKTQKLKLKKAQMPKQKFKIKIGKAQKLFNILLRCIFMCSRSCAL